MTLQTGKPRTPRERGTFPERPADVGYSYKPVSVAIKLDPKVYNWLESFCDDNPNSFFFSIEETITTAIRAMMNESEELAIPPEDFINLVNSSRKTTMQP